MSMNTHLRPLQDRIVVTRTPEVEKTEGGIIIPGNAREKPAEGTVVAVGPGKWNEQGMRAAPDVQPGDVVLFGKYAGTEVTVEEQDYVVLREDELLAIATR